MRGGAGGWKLATTALATRPQANAQKEDHAMHGDPVKDETDD
jgi:hypothetical protein